MSDKTPQSDQGKAEPTVSDRRRFIRMAGAGAGIAILGTGLTACGGGDAEVAADGSKQAAAAAPKKTKMDTPTVTCYSQTQASITLQVSTAALGTGATAGFSIQWMTMADYIANGNAWYLSDDTRLCKASFSGNANLSRYNLAAGESVLVTLGEFLFDEGASTNCDGALLCGTDYLFRAFAHATSTLNRSDFTANVPCSTQACVVKDGGCTYTQGYWKTHGSAGPASEKVIDPVTGAISYISAWPATSLQLGLTTYSETQIQAIFNTPAAGNGLIALAHQLIAAKFNVLNGAAAPDDVVAAIAAADALIGALVVPPVGTGSLKSSVTSALTTALANFNEGKDGIPHCS